MTTEQYLAALEKLGLKKEPASRVLGISSRQAQRIAAGDVPVPKPIAKLVQIMIRRRLPRSARARRDIVERLT